MFFLDGFLILNRLYCAKIQGQEEKSTLTKIEELKSSPDFNFESTTYIDVLVVLARNYRYFKPDSTAILLHEANGLSLKVVSIIVKVLINF